MPVPITSTTLLELLAKIRTDLADSVPQKWDDAELESALDRALAEYNLVSPKQAYVDEFAAAGTYVYQLGAGNLNIFQQYGDTIYAVEFPYDATLLPHRNWCHYEVRAGYLTLITSYTPIAGDAIRVHYYAQHTYNPSTWPRLHDDMIILGATLYALEIKAASIPQDPEKTDEPTVADTFRKEVTRRRILWSNWLTSFRSAAHKPAGNTANPSYYDSDGRAY